jgi:hypothetical protein
MNCKKILGLFAIAVASAGVSSASASCIAAANLYNKAGYDCDWLRNSYGVFSYSCSGGGRNWVLLSGVNGGCTAAPTRISKVTTFTMTNWVPKLIVPSLKLTR